MRRRLIGGFILSALAAWCAGQPAVRNAAAVQDIEAGKLTTANASWWGFNAEDSTAALQAAIDSKAKKVIVPFVGEPWIIRPIKLRSDLELIFEPGVLVLAKKGEFQGRGDSLFTADGAANLVIRGYGATLRMRKHDYQNPPYAKAEWRMGFAIHGCKNVLIEGVRVESTGGDGFYISGGGGRRWSEDVVIRNAVAHDNHRQGISVISAVNLLVENCVFSATSGTAPEAGIDIEPNHAEERLMNCVIRDCLFEDNSGDAIQVHLSPLMRASEPVSIRFENCHSRMGKAGAVPADFKDFSLRGGAGMAVGAIKDDGPKGTVEFIHCTSENTGREGARVYAKSADSARVRFVECSWKNPWAAAQRTASGLRAPVLVSNPRPVSTKRIGGVDFVDCQVYDGVSRPAVVFDEPRSDLGVFDLRGRITARGPAEPWTRLGPKTEGVTLQVTPPARPAAERNEAAIADVASGKLTTANAAWWGFNAEDSTVALQSAIDSKAKKVIVPFLGDPWIIRPVKLRGDLELFFEPGVLVLAKKGEFQGGGDSLFTASGASNLVIRGYQATLRMRKLDYQNPPYRRAEWRMGIALRKCRNVLVEGVRVESTGGDGFYVEGSEDITIRNAVAHENHRQGLSVVGAKNLLVENCRFAGTKGTPPEAGIDLEPDTADQGLVNCVVRNCLFENNSGHAILVYMKPLTRASEAVSIRFENCHSRMGAAGATLEDFNDMSQRGWAGMAVGAVRDDGPQGLVEFVNCTSENTGKEGLRVFDKSAKSVRLRLVNCSWKNPWISAHRDAPEPRAPILVQLRRPLVTTRQGGVEFQDCYVYDYVPRPALWADEEQEGNHGVYDLRGRLTVRTPGGAKTKLGAKAEGVYLKLE